MYTIGTYEIYKEAMNLRDKPSTSGAIIGEIPQSSKIEIIEIADSWGKTTFQNKIGWCYISEVYARRVGAVTSPPYCDYKELYETEKMRADRIAIILDTIMKALSEIKNY